MGDTNTQRLSGVDSKKVLVMSTVQHQVRNATFRQTINIDFVLLVYDIQGKSYMNREWMFSLTGSLVYFM